MTSTGHRSSILWYVHDVGLGHVQRCRAVLPHMTSHVVVVSSRPDLGTTVAGRHASTRRLRSDVVIDPEHGPGPFHHVPIGAVARRRAADVLDAAERHDCATAVVDVSVETAVLCRLAGLRVVVVRQSGRRDDPAHTLAHQCADVVWIPQHEALEPHVAGLPAVRHTGAFSRYDAAPRGDRAARRTGARPGRALVVALVGAGGSTFPLEAWRTEDPPPGVDAVVLGGDTRWDTGQVRSLGHVEDPAPLLLAADVVVTAAGWASVHDLASLGVRAVLVAEPRPFDEQEVRVQALERAGLVVGRRRWPTPAELGGVVDSAAVVEPARWDLYYDHKGATRAAEMIEQVHDGAA